jgi:hypothetical protein
VILIWKRSVSISIWGCVNPCFIWRFPYGNREPFHMIPIWKRAFPISIWGCVNPRFHMGIPEWKLGAISYDSPYGNVHSPFPYRDVSIPVSKWGSLYGNRESFFLIPHMETSILHFHTGKRQPPIPYGDPCMEMGSFFLLIPHMETGIPHFHMGMHQSPF